MDNNDFDKVAISFLEEVVSFIQKNESNFTCTLKLDWANTRTCSRGGNYKNGPGISLSMKRVKEEELCGYYSEYASFENQPDIGKFSYLRQQTPFLGLKAIICHEVAHAFMGFKNSSCSSHGPEWKAVYRILRNEFVNHLINQEFNNFKIKSIKEKLEHIDVTNNNLAIFKTLCAEYGLKEEHFGKCFTYKNHKYRITGLNKRARKYPVEAVKDGTNSQFRFPPNFVLKNLT